MTKAQLTLREPMRPGHVQTTYEDERGRKQLRRVNTRESPLTWLYSRNRITRRQFDAGEQLRRDWTLAQLDARVTMRWDINASIRGTASHDAADASHAQIEAKKRFHQAMDSVGSGLSDVLWRVICAGEGLESAEKAMGWPVRAGKVVLSLALDRVGDYYKLT